MAMTDTPMSAVLIKELRDGLCVEEQRCRIRSAEAGCDCARIADYIERLCSELDAARAALNAAQNKEQSFVSSPGRQSRGPEMTDTPTLIARLEKAEGPDRELDLAILVHVAGIPADVARHMTPVDVPEYTRSIDAALTLVPEGAEGHGYGFSSTGAEAVVSLDGESTFGEHRTSPAIALCAAALRARESTP